MTERKYTDEEIIKAMECCEKTTAIGCKDCPLGEERDTGETCVTTLCKNVLDLINRQKAEIEKLEKGELSKAMTFNSETIKRCVDEAIREFAERLKEKHKNHLVCNIYVLNNEIDNLVKEMTEENK